MNYQDFNRIVFDFYIARSSSRFIHLSIDEYEFNEKIIPLSKIPEILPSKNWNSLLEINESIPMYFGLIALQCLSASLMEKDKQNAANAYQVRLKKVLDIKDNNELQTLFRGQDPVNPIQEQIWHSAKEYLNEFHSLNLDIPAKTNRAGRFVQYPKSQSLLNTGDLKYYTVFFTQEFQIKEPIPYSYFESRFYACSKNIKSSKRAQKLMNDQDKKYLCLQQIFNYYNNWEGEVFDTNKNEITPVNNSTSKTRDENNLYLIFNNNNPEFYLDNSFSNFKIDVNEIFNIQNYRLFYKSKKIIIFTEIDYYPNQFENSRFIYFNCPCYILVDTSLKSNEYKFLENNYNEKIEIGESMMLYKLDYNDKFKNSILAEYFQEPHPVRLSGGIKINRKYQYLHGYGPSINCDNNYSIFFENKKCEYDSQKSLPGQYKVRIDNYRDIEFRIIEKPDSFEFIRNRNTGWNLKHYCVNHQYNLEGLSIRSGKMNQKSPIRLWIEINLNKKYNNSIKYEHGNFLLKAINNSKI